MHYLMIFVCFLVVMVIADLLTRGIWKIVEMKNSASAVTQAESLL